MVSKITDKIIPDMKEWQSRPLDPIYPFVFMDAIPYKVREDGRILNWAAYVVLGVILDGTKDILSIHIGANESSKFWIGMLNDLKNRGVSEVLFFCVDGLSGFKEAIHAIYPQERYSGVSFTCCAIRLKRKTGQTAIHASSGRLHHSFSYSVGTYNIPRISLIIPEVGFGQSPRKTEISNVYFLCQNV